MKTARSLALAVLLINLRTAAGAPAVAPHALTPMPPPLESKPAAVALGRQLFFDPRLSGDGSLACSTCHDPAQGFSDGLPLSKAYPGALHFRATPSVLNSGYRRIQYWDGRIGELGDLVRDHIADAQFMNADGRLVIERLRQVPEYEAGFKTAMGGEPTFAYILDALVAFLRTLRTTRDALDESLLGRPDALSPLAQTGLALFTGRAGCARCHDGALLTDEQFHRLGVPENPEIFTVPLRHITFRRFFKTLGVDGYRGLRQDVGLYAVTKRDADRRRFRTPSLRGVALRHAFFHNGVMNSLEAVVDFYNRGGGAGAELTPLGLGDEDLRALVAFLRTLGGAPAQPLAPVAAPAYQLRRLGHN